MTGQFDMDGNAPKVEKKKSKDKKALELFGRSPSNGVCFDCKNRKAISFSDFRCKYTNEKVSMLSKACGKWVDE